MNFSYKIKVLITLVIAGLVAVAIVILSAYAAEIAYKNNEIMESNRAIEGEIQELEMRIKTSSSMKDLEKIAMNKYGMVKPNTDQCISLTEKDNPKEELSAIIRKNAYN